MSTQPLKVAMFPAYRSVTNTYTSSLADALGRENCQVDDFGWKTVWKGRYDVIHLHWVDHALSQSFVKSLRWALAMLLTLRIAKLKGTRVFLSFHNLEAHSQKNHGLHRWFRRRLHGLLDGIFFLSKASIPLAYERYPEIRQCDYTVVPHPHYRADYPNTYSQAEARAKLGLSDEARVMCFLGHVSPYKGVDRLVQAFSEIEDEDVFLIVAGKADRQYRAEIEVHLTGDRVLSRLGFVQDSDLQIYLNAADLVVLPFRKILNSGSALLGLSFDRPVLTTRHPALLELQEIVGDDWIRFLPDGEFSGEDLIAGLGWAQAVADKRCTEVDDLNWEEAAKLTVGAYRRSVHPHH